MVQYGLNIQKEVALLNNLDGKKLARSLLLFFLPILSVFPGMALSLHYGNFNAFSSFLFLLFVLFNAFSQGLVETSPDKQVPHLAIGLSIINLVIALVLSLNHSLFLGFNLVLYMVLIHIRPIFHYYHLNNFYSILLLVFQAVFLNLASFFINMNFISLNLLLFIVPLVLPRLLYQEANYFKKRIYLSNILIFMSIALTILAMAFAVQFWSLLALLAIPMIYYLSKFLSLHAIYTCLFTIIIFQLVFITLY